MAHRKDYPMKYLCQLFFSLLFISSCGDDEGQRRFSIAEGEYMLSNNKLWTLEEGEYMLSNDKFWVLTSRIINNAVSINECEQDDTLFFTLGTGKNEEGESNPDRFAIDAGDMPCEGEQTDSLSHGTWKLLNSDAKTGISIEFYRKTDTLSAAVTRISGQFLTLYYQEEEVQVEEEYVFNPQ